MSHPIRFGVQTGQQNIEWSVMLDTWQKIDAWGYDSLWNFDHFYPIFVDPDGPCFEGWATLSALAQATRRARIGHLVNGNTYRHPCVTAKMAATLDHISGGRFNLGIGAGWFELEHQAFGIDFKLQNHSRTARRPRRGLPDHQRHVHAAAYVAERQTLHRH
jgi:alkanesulfonate monooxygenase SsuD/methylene tetrahydromethanopterin reductase-like flavin-dependent oxidoreductase (luciferase family)